MSRLSNKYDAVIIGAGIGGLVCGCYLAKAGMKVLIVEKNPSVGGYCSSFTREKYRFDSCVHYLGGCRKKGAIGKIFSELGLEKDISLIRADVSDIFLTPAFNFSIRSDFNNTIQQFQKRFKNESNNIESFFDFIRNSDFASLFACLKNKTFIELLREYFIEDELINVFNAFIMCEGSSIEKISALAAVILFKEYIIDGGYYPIGGMQAFSNGLLTNYKRCGGHILLSMEITRILHKNGEVEGVECSGGELKFFSKIVIANNGPRDIFLKFLNGAKPSKNFIDRLMHLQPTISAFIVYLGLRRSLSNVVERSRGLWFFSHLNTSIVIDNIKRGILKDLASYFLCAFTSTHDKNAAPPNCESMQLIVGAPFKNDIFWKNNKDEFAASIVNMASAVFGNFSDDIEVKEIATPQTLYSYTYNTEGALYGWESTLHQCNKDLMPQEIDFIDGLYLVGHWTTHESGQGGLGMVFHTARTLAKSILRRRKGELTRVSI